MNKELRRIEEVALRAGWTSRLDGGNHLRLTSPYGGYVSLPTTPSDVRSMKNCRAQIKAMGLDLQTGEYTPYSCKHSWHEQPPKNQAFCPMCKGTWGIDDIPKVIPPATEVPEVENIVITAEAPINVEPWLDEVLEALGSIAEGAWTAAEDIDFLVGAPTRVVEACLDHLHRVGLVRKRGDQYQVGEPEPEPEKPTLHGVHRLAILVYVDQVAKDEDDAFDRIVNNLNLHEGEFHFVYGPNNVDPKMFSSKIVGAKPVLGKRTE